MMLAQQNIDLSQKCSFRIGGAASWYCRPTSITQIRSTLKWAQRRNEKIFVLGKGTNLLISDRGWDGLIMDMTAFCSISWNMQSVYAYSGALLHKLVTHAVIRGSGGIEQLAGIPGTVGGGVIMNAGAFSQTISETIQYVDIVEPQQGCIRRLSRNELAFGYRDSSLRQSNALVLGACFLLSSAEGDALKNSYREILKRRRLKQPLEFPNCGSVFKRPEGGYAGTLIERCGLKGMRIGGAMISDKHANFIINDKHACAEDVRNLIATAQEKVYQRTGILLEPEVIFLGEFERPLFRPAD
ncbi:MAG: UDP-N-acetylmuramate dehydrogenase [Chitinispirillaceae bacterium]